MTLESSYKIFWCFLLILGILQEIVACPSECRCAESQTHCRRLPASKLQQIPRNTRVL